MPVSLNALRRYRILDRCLKDKSRIYQAEDLLEAIHREFISEGLSDKKPSRRTLDYDLSHLRQGKIGKEAPISYSPESGYYYEDPHFSLFSITIPSRAIKDLTQAILLLKQITQEDQLPGIVQSINLLETELQLQIDLSDRPAIYLEKSTNELGTFWINTLYDYIQQQQTIRIDYQPFDQEECSLVVSPYHLNESNGRWFLTCWEQEKKRVIQLGLDRMNAITPSIQPFYRDPAYDHDDFKKYVFGVTKPADSTPILIRFKADRLQSFYIDTKPIHHSQQKLESSSEGSTYSIEVYNNYEIKARLLSYGDSIEILGPDSFRAEIITHILKMQQIYIPK